MPTDATDANFERVKRGRYYHRAADDATRPRWVLAYRDWVVSIDDGDGPRAEKAWPSLDELLRGVGVSRMDFDRDYELVDEPELPTYRVVVLLTPGGRVVWEMPGAPELSFLRAVSCAMAFHGQASDIIQRGATVCVRREGTAQVVTLDQTARPVAVSAPGKIMPTSSDSAAMDAKRAYLRRHSAAIKLAVEKARDVGWKPQEVALVVTSRDDPAWFVVRQVARPLRKFSSAVLVIARTQARHLLDQLGHGTWSEVNTGRGWDYSCPLDDLPEEGNVWVVTLRRGLSMLSQVPIYENDPDGGLQVDAVGVATLMHVGFGGDN